MLTSMVRADDAKHWMIICFHPTLLHGIQEVSGLLLLCPMITDAV